MATIAFTLFFCAGPIYAMGTDGAWYKLWPDGHWELVLTKTEISTPFGPIVGANFRAFKEFYGRYLDIESLGPIWGATMYQITPPPLMGEFFLSKFCRMLLFVQDKRDTILGVMIKYEVPADNLDAQNRLHRFVKTHLGRMWKKYGRPFTRGTWIGDKFQPYFEPPEVGTPERRQNWRAVARWGDKRVDLSFEYFGGKDKGASLIVEYSLRRKIVAPFATMDDLTF